MPESKFWSGNLASVAMGVAVALPLGFFALAPSDAYSEPAAAPARGIGEYQKTVLPLLEKHCYECHGDGYDKGKIAFDQLETPEQILNTDLWLRVLLNTRAGLMPAEDNPRLSAAEQATLERWIKRDVFHIDPRQPDPGRVTVRRLNRVEYRNTVHDLLGVDFNTDHEFPPDDTGFGFDNIGDALTTSPMLLEKYVAAAQTIIKEAVPLVARKPRASTISGNDFAGTNARSKWGRRQLLFSEPASIAASFRNDLEGSYRVKFDLQVNGTYNPDPGKARLILKVDGKEIANQELSYHDEKDFTFESKQKWKPGEHAFSIEMQPTVPEQKKETITDLFVTGVTVEGPLEPAAWVTPENYARYFPRAVPKGRAERHAYAAEILGAFATRAYRRPLEDDTASRLAALAEATYTQKGKSFEQGVAHAMAAVLASPRFLFRLEQPAPHAVNVAVADVDEYSLASRLSYFLWSTMPDAELTQLAAQGQLRANLGKQVTRMLADPRAENLARNFTGQWLQARDVEGIASNPRQIILRDAGAEEMLRQLRQAWMKQDETTAKALADKIDRIVDAKPEFDGKMRTAMRRETEMYFAYVARENRPVTELIDSNYTFLNEELAKMYDIGGVEGKELRKVTLPEGSPRGGVLTQGSALVVTSNPDRTSPVKRGLFVLSNFLGTPPPPPPANVPALEASESEFEKGQEPTLREVLKVHREAPLCRSCHNRMDPIGLAFENFNAIGAWRDTERRQPIAAEGSLITGETFTSVSQLKKILANDHRDEFYHTLTSKLLTYATGRGMEYYDVETIDQIVQRLKAQDGRFAALLTGIVESAPFQKMRTQATVVAVN
jgi:mono/diheme cytochrome c family protein